MPLGHISLYPQILKLLNSGGIYFHGRDHFLRPIIAINFMKFDLKNNTEEDYLNYFCFVLDYAAKNMCLPGKIESWVVLADLCNSGIGELSLSSLRHISKVLTLNFRCRLGACYVYNTPKALYYL